LGLKTKRIFSIGTIIAIIAFGIVAATYIAFSRSNPHIIQMIISSVSLGIVIGIIPSLVSTLFKNQINSNSVMGVIVAISSMTILIALLVYSSNQPKSIKGEIPVTYLVISVQRNFLPL
jgi:ABC-type transport system involved in multi-copper enzyme maturation permease subunit